MTFELVGKQMVDFPDKQTGEQIQGIKLHYLTYDDHVSGRAAVTQFIRINNPCYSRALGLALGEFMFVFGPKGRVMDVVQESTPEPAGKK